MKIRAAVFFRNVANRQTYRQTDRQTRATDNDENIAFAMAEVIKKDVDEWFILHI